VLVEVVVASVSAAGVSLTASVEVDCSVVSTSAALSTVLVTAGVSVAASVVLVSVSASTLFATTTSTLVSGAFSSFFSSAFLGSSFFSASFVSDSFLFSVSTFSTLGASVDLASTFSSGLAAGLSASLVSGSFLFSGSTFSTTGVTVALTSAFSSGLAAGFSLSVLLASTVILIVSLRVAVTSALGYFFASVVSVDPLKLAVFSASFFSSGFTSLASTESRYFCKSTALVSLSCSSRYLILNNSPDFFKALSNFSPRTFLDSSNSFLISSIVYLASATSAASAFL